VQKGLEFIVKLFQFVEILVKAYRFDQLFDNVEIFRNNFARSDLLYAKNENVEENLLYPHFIQIFESLFSKGQNQICDRFLDVI